MPPCIRDTHVTPASVPGPAVTLGSYEFFCMLHFMKQHNYYVYLLTTNNNLTFYVGVTNDLVRRMVEHKTHYVKGFTSEYNGNKLVYFETFSNIEDAITREKQMKCYKRLWKYNLVNSNNSEWNDLSEQIGVTKEMIENVRQLMPAQWPA